MSRRGIEELVIARSVYRILGGELLHPTLGDWRHARVCCAPESKFHKSRGVALSASARCELRGYLRKRLAQGFDTQPNAPLLCNTTRGLHGYTGTGLSRGIQALFEAAGMRDDQGRRPRTHDLRHAFAAQALIRWYRQGADVPSHLPKLAMYMGHVSIVFTAYYLRFKPEIAGLASARFERGFGEITGGTRMKPRHPT